MPFEIFESVWGDAVAAGAVPAGLAAWEIARVEAGRPEWGIDIDENTIPQEANLDELDAISYTKGCYIGQEVVARVHFRGHVNRHLRGLRAAGGGAPPPTGAQLIDDTGNHVGDVRSAVSSPRLGGIAIGMVRREVEPGRVADGAVGAWRAASRRGGASLLGLARACRARSSRAARGSSVRTSSSGSCATDGACARSCGRIRASSTRSAAKA